MVTDIKDSSSTEKIENQVFSNALEKKIDLPDDSGEKVYKSELPDDSGNKPSLTRDNSTQNDAGKVFDKCIEENDGQTDSISNNLKNCPIGGNHGKWDGERGNSTWYPDRDYVPRKSNPEGNTWGEILDKYGIDGITYKDGEPDFSEISRGTVKIEPFSDNRTDNFDNADIELANQKGCTPEEVADWRKENGYTWHECKDMKTMQKVPSEVHNNISHCGGISEVKKGSGEV